MLMPRPKTVIPVQSYMVNQTAALQAIIRYYLIGATARHLHDRK